MNYSDILVRLRKERGLTQTAVADFINKYSSKKYGFANVSSWEKGALPPIEPFLLMCELYEVKDIQETFRSVKRKRYGLEKLNALGLGRAEEYISMLSGNPLFAEVDDDYYSDRNMRIIKLYRVPVAAGFGEYLDGSDYDDFMVDETVPDGTDYAVKVSGDSMEPRLVDRQVVFIKEQQTLEIGEIGIFSLDGDAFIKKLGHGELISLNSRYAPIPIREHNSVHIFGKVLGG